MSFKKVAIANRGAVAARLVRTLRELGMGSLVLCSEADASLPYVLEADEFAVIGPAPPRDSYLNGEAVAGAAKRAGASALHPGWGFLSENADFAGMVRDMGMVFIGPRPELLSVMGDKVAARGRMMAMGLPAAPSTGILSGTLAEKAAEAAAIGFPLLIKPAGGGGGIGMIPAEDGAALLKAIESAESAAARGFGNASLYAERLIRNPRHVEFQIVSDSSGQCLPLPERDCSLQRRRQKILEEAGAPGIKRELLSEMSGRAASVMTRLGYDSLGTVETLYSEETGFGFLEVNPRLQVEHAVTEEVTGLDLVRIQILAAAGEKLSDLIGGPVPSAPLGHAMEARIYAEDSLRFLPSPGRLEVFRPPAGMPGVRVETGFAEGHQVTPFYDPMIAQVIAGGADRAGAIKTLAGALAAFEVAGLKTNIPFLRVLLADEGFLAGRVHTSMAEELVRTPSYRPALEALG